MKSDAETAPRPRTHLLRIPGATRFIKVLSDKWTIPVIHMLIPGTRRHAELRRGMPTVSQRMLTKTLRSLERHGLVTRRIHSQVPPRVEYSLTSLGRSLNKPVAEICRWVERYGAELDGVGVAVEEGKPGA